MNQDSPRSKRPLIPSFSSVNNNPAQNKQYFKNLAHRRNDGLSSNYEQRWNSPSVTNVHSDQRSNFDHIGQFFQSDDTAKPAEKGENHRPHFSVRINNQASANNIQEGSSTRQVNLKPAEDVMFSINLPDRMGSQYRNSEEEDVFKSRSVINSSSTVVKHSLLKQDRAHPSYEPRLGEGGVYERLGPPMNINQSTERRVKCKPDIPSPQFHSRSSHGYEAKKIGRDRLADDIDGEDYIYNEKEMVSPPKDRRVLYKPPVTSTDKEDPCHDKSDKEVSVRKRHRHDKVSSDDLSSEDNHIEKDKKHKRTKKHKNKDSKKKKKSKKVKKSKKSKSHKRTRQTSTSSDSSTSFVEALEEPDMSEFTNEPAEPENNGEDPANFGQKLILDLLREAIKKQGAEELKKRYLDKPGSVYSEESKKQNVPVLKNDVVQPRTHNSNTPGNHRSPFKSTDVAPNSPSQASGSSSRTPFKDPSTKPIYKEIAPGKVSSNISPPSPPSALTKMDYIAAKYLSPGKLNQAPADKPRRQAATPFNNPAYQPPPGPSFDTPTVKDWNTGKHQLNQISRMKKVLWKDKGKPTHGANQGPPALGLASCDTCKEYNLTVEQLEAHRSQDQHLMATGKWWDLHPNPNPIPQYCLIYCVLCKAPKAVGVDFSTIEDHEASKAHKKRGPQWKSNHGTAIRSTWCPLTSLKTTHVSLPVAQGVLALGATEKKIVGELYKSAVSVLTSRALLHNNGKWRGYKIFK